MTKVTVYNTTDAPLPLATCVVYGRERADVETSDPMLGSAVQAGRLVVLETDTRSRNRRATTKAAADAQQSAPTPGEHQDSTDVTGKEN